VKVNTLTQGVNYPSVVREKQDGGGGGGGASPDQRHSNSKHYPKDPSSPEKEEIEASSENVDKAIEDFHTQLQSKMNGLKASVQGTGPGLKVVLKDGTGSVVRQFTGEEFLRLRQATSEDGRVNGKILDQKL
jgi:uncharacterized FlaG/YvyC family protein